jgi:hypothetical protein
MVKVWGATSAPHAVAPKSTVPGPTAAAPLVPRPRSSRSVIEPAHTAPVTSSVAVAVTASVDAGANVAAAPGNTAPGARSTRASSASVPRLPLAGDTNVTVAARLPSLRISSGMAGTSTPIGAAPKSATDGKIVSTAPAAVTDSGSSMAPRCGSLVVICKMSKVTAPATASAAIGAATTVRSICSPGANVPPLLSSSWNAAENRTSADHTRSASPLLRRRTSCASGALPPQSLRPKSTSSTNTTAAGAGTAASAGDASAGDASSSAGTPSSPHPPAPSAHASAAALVAINRLRPICRPPGRVASA